MRFTVTVRRQSEYTRTFEAVDADAARNAAAAFLGVQDNGQEIEISEPRRLRGWRLRGQLYTLQTEGPR